MSPATRYDLVTLLHVTADIVFIAGLLAAALLLAALSTHVQRAACLERRDLLVADAVRDRQQPAVLRAKAHLGALPLVVLGVAEAGRGRVLHIAVERQDVGHRAVVGEGLHELVLAPRMRERAQEAQRDRRGVHGATEAGRRNDGNAHGR